MVTDKLSLNVRLRGTYTDTVQAGGLRAGYSLDVRSLPASIELNGLEFTITEKAMRAEDRSWVLQQGRYTTIDLDKITSHFSPDAAGAERFKNTSFDSSKTESSIALFRLEKKDWRFVEFASPLQ